MTSCCDQKGCPGIFSGVPVAKDEKMECEEQITNITKIGIIGNLRDSLLVICIFILLLFLFFDIRKL